MNHPDINILLVDDQSQNLLSLEALLESPDYRLIKAHSGQEALREILDHDFAVMLLDVQMPELDGFETAKLIKQRNQSKHIPIIFLTALDGDERHLHKGYSVGAVDYIVKPFNPEILKSKITVFVDLYRKNRQLWKEQAARADAEAAQNDSSFLVEASNLLASSLDYQKTLERVAWLSVPTFADWCAVDLIEKSGPVRLAVAHAESSKEERVYKLWRPYPFDPDVYYGIACVLRTGGPELLREIPDSFLQAVARDPAHLKILRELGPKSAMVVPLKVRDRILGAITFVSDKPDRLYNEADLSMSQELARRAALAIDNARLYEEAQKEIVERSWVEKRLSAQYEVVRLLAESSTLDEAAPRILQAICESLDWEIGGLWRLDPEAQLLRCVQTWHKPSLSFSEFEKVSLAKTFLPNEGLPGRIWAERGAVWIPDVVRDRNFPRGPIADDAGLHAAFGFPIQRGAEILGVLEFFSSEVRDPDTDLLLLMTSIGSQVGQFIERKRIEKAMQESEARKTAILQSALDCILTMDDRGRIIEFNPAAERTFGYRRDEVIGKEMADLIIPPSFRARHRQGLLHYLSSEEGAILGKRVEMTAMRSNGTEFPAELAVIRIPLDGQPMFTGYLRDITERKEAEAALQRKTVEAEESSRLKSHFVSNVSHELRTPINAIIGYSALLLDEAYGPIASEQQGPLQGVVRNARDLLSLINDVLDLSKIEAGKLSLHLEPVHLFSLLKGILDGIKLLLDQKPIEIQWDGIRDLPVIETDAAKLKQVFTNLLSNAIKFTSEGAIHLIGKNLPEKEGIEIAVQDTGIGIRPEELPRLFNAFHQVDADLTREYGGVGLGLRIVKDLVEFLKGEIRVESEFGKGSRFTVFFPYRSVFDGKTELRH